MSLQDQINADFLTAYKAKDEKKVSVLRLLKSALKNEEIAKKSALTDDEVVKVLKKEIKQRKDTALEYNKAQRAEMASKEEAEATIIEAYLPAQLDESALREIISQTIKELGATEIKDMGKVIGAVMTKHGSEVDGGLVSKIVKALLS